MIKHLKYFETHADYAAYINGQDKELPNVSYCEDNKEVHYNPWTDPRLIAKFNVADASKPTKLCEVEEASSPTSLYSKIDIDGVEVSPSTLFENEGYYQFDTTGEHIVKYTLINNTSIGIQAFWSCTNLTSVTIPNSVTSIDYGAFSGCSGLTSITIPSSVTNIGQGAFNGCTGLTSIIVDSNNATYDSRNNCNAIIDTATNTLIMGCQNTVIPNTVITIGEFAFDGCYALTSITIPNSVTFIEEGAFSGCTGLTSITIPNSVTTIDDMAFYNCSGLTSITSLSTTEPSIGNNTFQNIKTGGTLTVPSGSTGYDTWMGTGNYYLGLYNWTKVEQ